MSTFYETYLNVSDLFLIFLEGHGAFLVLVGTPELQDSHPHPALLGKWEG